MCEGDSEDSRHGTWLVDIQEGMCKFYLDVCVFAIA